MTIVSPPAWQPPSLEQMQTALPEFRFEELLGRGGMGAVYRAVQVSLGRTVAVKVLPAALMQRDEADYAVRFEREARVMGGLNHPGIVSVFGFGCAAGGLLYMVMEHVDGTDLSRHLRDCGRLPPDKAADFITQVCAALDCAHRAGIIHRDIKPANILLAHDGTVKVADFGLARLEDPAARGLTKTNVAAGTPEFLAPEALAPGAVVDARADIYALGVVLYQMLTGELPHGRWKLPGERRADARFDAVIRKAMQPGPGARYQSTVALQRDLHAALTAAPHRRTSSRCAIAAAAAMILLAAAAWHWWPRREASALDSGAARSSRVTNNNGSGPGSLQQALLDAMQTPGPDTITFDPSLSGQTIVLETRFVPFDNAPPPPDISAAFTVDASSLPGGLTIKPPAGFNAFIFKHAECDVTLRGLTLSGGGGAYGSFLINDGTITLLDCRITGNQASANGGALGNNGTMRLVRCLVSSNTAGGKGGAINTLGTFIAEDCTFSGNTAALGGAVSVGGGTAEFTRCTFYGNEASRTGGAITIFRTVKATHCTFAGNKATGTATGIHGGGAFAFMDSGGALELDASIVAGNTAATDNGPDIWRQTGNVTAVRSLIGIADDTGITAADGNLTGSLAQPLDAKLSPPGDYGGSTQTMPPLPDSPAKASAKGSTATVDQRGEKITGVPSIGAAQ